MVLVLLLLLLRWESLRRKPLLLLGQKLVGLPLHLLLLHLLLLHLLPKLLGLLTLLGVLVCCL